MKVLVLGGSGMLGHKLVHCWRDRFDVWTTFRHSASSFEKYGFYEKRKIFENVQAENFDSVLRVLAELKPDVVVNCIGLIKQLKESKSIIPTLTLNSIFPHRLALACEVAGARMITLSTDCVFSGEKADYKEDDVADAIDLYGRSKFLGEVTAANCLTVRTSIIGRELGSAHSLVEWFLSNQNKIVKGFRKAIYTGFPTVVFADILADIIEKQPDLSGVWHISSDPINKFDLLNLIKEAYQVNIGIEPFDDFAIDRSLNSDKFREATGFAPQSWENMIEQMAADSRLINY